MRGTAVLVAALALASACRELEDLDENVCGNYVIDDGEDCDEGPDTDNGANDCERCSLRCTEEGFCRPTDPRFAGYACGIDGFCQAPSGTVGEASAQISLATTTFAITDVDQDAIGDVVALTSTSVTVNFGDEGGFLEAQTSTLTPTIQGTPAFTTLDDDGTIDLVLPTIDGIVAYSSPFGVLAPHAFSIDLTRVPAGCNSPISGAFFVFAVDERRLGVVYQAAAELRIALVDSHGHDACAETTAKLCDAVMGSPEQVVAYRTSNPLPEHVLAVVTPTGLCAATVRQDTPAPTYTLRSFTPAAPIAPFAGTPVLADLDGTTCPSIIDSSQGAAALREYRGSRSSGDCTIAASSTSIDAGAQYAAELAVGSVPLVPPIAGRGADALVLTGGIVAVDRTRATGTPGADAFHPMYVSDRTLFDAHAGDFDGNGTMDLVALAALPSPTGPTPTEDVDVLYRTTGPDGFLRYRVDSSAPVTEIGAGDFDGNGADDVVFAELVPPGQRVSLAYGTSDRVLPPVQSAAFAFVVGLLPLQAPDSSDPLGLIDDLGIVDLVDAMSANPLGKPRFTLLHGSTQRALLSFFDPRTSPSDSSRFVGVAAYETESGAPVANLMAIEHDRGTTVGWPLANNGGNLEFSTGRPLTEFGSCQAGAPAQVFCGDLAKYVPWSIGARDVVIGIDPAGPQRVAVIDPSTSGGAQDPLRVVRSTVFDDVTMAVTSVRAIDTDGDATKELVVAFGAMSDDGDVRICRLDASGLPESCASIAALAPQLDGAQCTDVAPANFVARGPLDTPPPPGQTLVALCQREGYRQLWQLVPDGIAGYTATQIQIGDDTSAIVRVQAGDVTGDGLDDLLLVRQVPTDSTTRLLVYPQCPARDRSCRTIEDP